MTIAQVNVTMGVPAEAVTVESEDGTQYTQALVYGYNDGIRNQMLFWLWQLTGRTFWGQDLRYLVRINFNDEGLVEEIQRGVAVDQN